MSFVGIGELIGQLSDEFADLTVSKVRFLETKGLLAPIRTPSGYRRYSADDVERLRYILRAQRDHFLPLRVIKEHLDAMSRGLTPPDLDDPSPRVPVTLAAEVFAEPEAGGVWLSRAELLRSSGLSSAQLTDAEQQGLLAAQPDGHYGIPELEIARSVAGLADFGLTARHLRAIRLAAERHMGLVDQIASAGRQDGRSRADAAEAVAVLSTRLEVGMIAAHLRTHRGELS